MLLTPVLFGQEEIPGNGSLEIWVTPWTTIATALDLATASESIKATTVQLDETPLSSFRRRAAIAPSYGIRSVYPNCDRNEYADDYRAQDIAVTRPAIIFTVPIDGIRFGFTPRPIAMWHSSDGREWLAADAAPRDAHGVVIVVATIRCLVDSRE